VTRIRVYQLLQGYAATAKINHRISAHNLRHTYGTEPYRAERDPLAVANALGHQGLAYVQTYVKEVETGEAQPFRPDWG
jgi:site-specific recombinase XerD